MSSGRKKVLRTLLKALAIYMVITGIIITLLWPQESTVYFNPLLVMLGDKIYNKAINVIGDPTSPQAHYTIPWPLRIPQVYFITSIIISIILYFISRKL